MENWRVLLDTHESLGVGYARRNELAIRLMCQLIQIKQKQTLAG
jgi:hypothetical protein